MTVEFHLPDIGEGLHEAEVVNWLVAVGDTVERNQPFVEILTDKSTVEMPAPAAGTVSRLGVAEGEMVQVGELLVIIEDGNQATAAVAADPSVMAAAERPSSTEPVAEGVTPSPARSGRRPKASPSTRRLAAERGVDLQAVTGTGPGGRILAEDVTAQRADSVTAQRADSVTAQRADSVTAQRVDSVTAQRAEDVKAKPASAVSATFAPGVHALRGVRRATAKAMDLSWSTIPHISAMNEINAERLLSARTQIRELSGPDAPNVTPLVIALLAIAKALRNHPIMNATLDLDAETITVHQQINLGVAVATDYGLMVPVIHDADRLDLWAMAAELGRLTAAARNRSVKAADLEAGTYTVTNFGSQGTYVANPIIRPGETGITGLGSIAPRPIVIDGEVVARPTLPVVVCGDHRLVDGDVMSAFHNDICQSLQAPIGLLL